MFFPEARAADAVRAIVRRGAQMYVRQRDLPRILPIGPEELADETREACKRILARLARALRAERNRGRAGHWMYDLNRHIALAQACAAERRLLRGEAAVDNSDDA